MKGLKFVLAALALTLPFAGSASAEPGLVVATDLGQVRGERLDGVESWKGIPFAAPPVGPLRWRAPQTVAAWTGVREATSYGHDCMQAPLPMDAAPLGAPPAEDCLYLNVWRPAAATRSLPVIVWIYGGGFVNGGSSPATYSGAALAKQGVVFVSFNYRLGRFGAFGHPQLTAANEDGGLLYNYGYLDQIAALKWVRRNVAAFGGDPRNVTVVGHSAGGMSVHALVTAPLAKGLFAKAVVMSGGDGSGMGAETPAGAEKIGVVFAQSKGIAADDPQALRKLRALSAQEVTDGLNIISILMPSGPRTFASPPVDGRIAVDAKEAYRDGSFVHVSMMIGATSADVEGPTGIMVAGARNMASVIANQGVPVYRYRFSYVADSARSSGSAGAEHASDVPFFLHTEKIKYGEKTTPKDIEVGRQISAYVVNFAKTGDPNGAGLPSWSRYDRADDPLMDFAENGRPTLEKDRGGTDVDATHTAAAHP